MPWFEDVSERLAAAPVGRIDPDGLTRAAVLVPVYVSGGELWVLLTRRADGLDHHAGQIAFPGGVRDDADEDEVATALRELDEELGIDPDAVMILGSLSDQVTTNGHVVSPVVGALPYPHVLRPAPAEVAAICAVPFAALVAPRLVEWQVLEVGGQTVESPVFHVGGHRIWGVTARIAAELVERLTASPSE